MRIYHGSKRVIDIPLCKGSDEKNDYGPAFYITEELESAKEWACKNNSIGYVSEYSFDISGLKVLDLTDKTKWSVLNWIAILLHFRYLEPSFRKQFPKSLKYLEENYFIDVEEYDVIKGFRADDAYFRFPLDFVRNNLTLDQLEYVYSLGDLGIQYALISKKAIKRINYKKSFLAEKEYINKYFENVNRCTKLYDSISKEELGTRLIDLVREYDLSK